MAGVDVEDEKRAESTADMNRCWIKFLLGLLEHSKDALVFADFEKQSGLVETTSGIWCIITFYLIWLK